MIRVKHILAKPMPEDGERIYVDRLWTDGAFTEFVKISEWPLEIAPSYELWRFHGKPESWDTYTALYKKELEQPDSKEQLKALAQKAKKGTITLVYGNGTPTHNNALILKEVLSGMVMNGKE